MQNIKLILLILFIGLNTSPIYCQIIEQPSERQLKKHDSIVIKSMRILERNVVNIDSDIRNQLYEMLSELIDKESIKFKEPIKLLEIFEENNLLINIYKAGYIRYLHENKNPIDSFFAIKAGLISIITAYQRGNELKKSTEMDALVELYHNGKLDLFIKDNF